MFIVGFSGKARSGKDTSAAYMCNKLLEYGYSVNIKAYACKLKQNLMRDFDLSHEQLYGVLKEQDDERYVKADGSFWSPREIMQAYGQFIRSISSDYWVNSLFDKLDESKDFLLITDVRQPNEVKSIVDRGGCVLRIERSDAPKIKSSNHETETALDNTDLNIDRIIHNDGTLEELYSKIENVIQIILDKKEKKNGEQKRVKL